MTGLWTLTCQNCGRTFKNVGRSSSMLEPGLEVTAIEHNCESQPERLAIESGKLESFVMVKKLSSSIKIHDVEHVRLLQDMGYIDPQRDPEDFYRELTTGERRDPETENERDRARLIAMGQLDEG